MVKDEDVCLHCGLCAERCPTGAWDMRRFLFAESYAGRGEDYSANPVRKKVAA
jgi:ferredoxin